MATNDVYLRPDAGDGTNGVRLRPDGPDVGGAAPFIPNVPQDGVRLSQRGFVDIAASLLLTTLAVAATAPFIPTLFEQPAPVKYQQQTVSGYNLSIYAPPAVAAPFIPVSYPNQIAKQVAQDAPVARNYALLDQPPFRGTIHAPAVTPRASQDAMPANLLPLSQRPFVPQIYDVRRAPQNATAALPQNLLLSTLAPAINGGGGAEYVYQRYVIYWQDKREQRKHRSINEIFDSQAEEMYDDISKDGSKEVQRQAVAIIRDFTDSDAVKPRVKSIDWNAVNRDAEAVAALFKLWSDEAFLQEEEEMIAILMLMS